MEALLGFRTLTFTSFLPSPQVPLCPNLSVSDILMPRSKALKPSMRFCFPPAPDLFSLPSRLLPPLRGDKPLHPWRPAPACLRPPPAFFSRHPLPATPPPQGLSRWRYVERAGRCPSSPLAGSFFKSFSRVRNPTRGRRPNPTRFYYTTPYSVISVEFIFFLASLLTVFSISRSGVPFTINST